MLHCLDISRVTTFELIYKFEFCKSPLCKIYRRLEEIEKLKSIINNVHTSLIEIVRTMTKVTATPAPVTGTRASYKPRLAHVVLTGPMMDIVEPSKARSTLSQQKSSRRSAVSRCDAVRRPASRRCNILRLIYFLATSERRETVTCRALSRREGTKARR